jgi:uncharacterized membrane protein YkoI
MTNRLRGMLATVVLTGLALSASGAQADADIGFCRAEQIAIEKVKGVVKEMERDAKKGKPVYKVDVRTPEGATFDVLIDAVSGEVLRVKQDD